MLLDLVPVVSYHKLQGRINLLWIWLYCFVYQSRHFITNSRISNLLWLRFTAQMYESIVNERQQLLPGHDKVHSNFVIQEADFTVFDIERASFFTLSVPYLPYLQLVLKSSLLLYVCIDCPFVWLLTRWGLVIFFFWRCFLQSLSYMWLFLELLERLSPLFLRSYATLVDIRLELFESINSWDSRVKFECLDVWKSFDEVQSLIFLTHVSLTTLLQEQGVDLLLTFLFLPVLLDVLTIEAFGIWVFRFSVICQIKSCFVNDCVLSEGSGS